MPMKYAPYGSGEATEFRMKLVKSFIAEFLAMTLFVFVGCGSACAVAGTGSWVLQVSLTFGLAISCLAYTIGHISGGHINCAVTLGLVLAGACGPIQGFVIFVAEMLGAIAGAAFLALVFDGKLDQTGGLATNSLGDNISVGQAITGEVMMTFLLMYVVLETATNEKASANGAQAPLAIGLAVFLAHSVLIPLDGCSINPTRSFGPALMQTWSDRPNANQWKDHWVFWVGPCLGSMIAVLVFKLISPKPVIPAPEEPVKRDPKDL